MINTRTKVVSSYAGSLQISDDLLQKLKVKDFSQLSVDAKTELARLLSGWFEENIGRESQSIKDVREVSDRFLAHIAELHIEGEYIIFVNNYIAFLILECENEYSKQILDQWTKKLKEYDNIEWKSLLFASYSELIIRAYSPQSAYQKVAKICRYITRNIEKQNYEGQESLNLSNPEDVSRGTIPSKMLISSYCSILINCAKLTLAIEDGEDTIEKVKSLVETARKFNRLREPIDQGIERIIDKIENIYRDNLEETPNRGKNSIPGEQDSSNQQSLQVTTPKKGKVRSEDGKRWLSANNPLEESMNFSRICVY